MIAALKIGAEGWGNPSREGYNVFFAHFEGHKTPLVELKVEHHALTRYYEGVVRLLQIV